MSVLMGLCVFFLLFFSFAYTSVSMSIYTVCACVCLDKRMCTPFLFVFVCKEHH